MASYDFVTVWNVSAPVEVAWKAIRENEKWPEWWQGVLSVAELRPGDDSGLGAVHRSIWRSRLPYTLEFDSEVVRIDELRSIEIRAFGELEGRGVWTFSPDGDSCRVQYDWSVFTNKAWMNFLAPVARPFFRWNHDAIMAWGEEGLRRRCRDIAQTK